MQAATPCPVSRLRVDGSHCRPVGRGGKELEERRPNFRWEMARSHEPPRCTWRIVDQLDGDYRAVVDCCRLSSENPRMKRSVNDAQQAVLNWIATDPHGEPPAAGYKHSALALEARGLAKVSRRGGRWSAVLTDAGWFYYRNGIYPPAESKQASSSRQSANSRQRSHPEFKRSSLPKFQVDSPERIRAQGFKPHGDDLRLPDEPDPWDARVMITVKEAAWLLSMSEQGIRRAVTDGEVARVFIGSGTSHYRIVYGSLLAWVNRMRKHDVHRQWWSRR